MPLRCAQELPGHDVGMVLQLRQDDAIARLQQRAVGVGHEIDRRRAAAGEHDLHRIDAEKVRHLDAGVLVGLGGALGQAMHAAQHVGAAGRLVGAHGVEHGLGRLRRGAVVEIVHRLAVDDLRQDGELPADGCNVETHGLLRARQAASASGVSMSVTAASPVISTSQTRSACSPIRCLAPRIAGELGHLGEEAPRPQHRIAALAAHRRHADRAALDGTERRHQAIEQRRADARHVAELDDGRIDILAERADAGAHRRAEPFGEIRIGHEAQPRLGRDRLLDGRPHLVRHVAEHHDDLDGLRGERRLDGMHDQRLAFGIGQHLVGPAHARRAAGGEHQHGDSWRLLRARLLAVAVVARLRAARDLGQQAAGAHAHDLGAADRQAGGQALQHHVEAVVLGRLGAARQAQHRLAVELGGQQQVAGIDRHAEMDDLAARLLDAGRHDVVAVDDRRGAGDQEDVAALGPELLQSAGDGLGVVRDPPLADQRAAERGQPLGRGADRLVEDLVARAGEPGLHQPRLHRLERRDGDQRLVGRIRHLERPAPTPCAARHRG